MWEFVLSVLDIFSRHSILLKEGRDTVQVPGLIPDADALLGFHHHHSFRSGINFHA